MKHRTHMLVELVSVRGPVMTYLLTGALCAVLLLALLAVGAVWGPVLGMLAAIVVLLGALVVLARQPGTAR